MLVAYDPRNPRKAGVLETQEWKSRHSPRLYNAKWQGVSIRTTRQSHGQAARWKAAGERSEAAGTR